MKFLKMLEATPDPGHIHLYWLGQAGFLIKNSLGKVMLIDAYLSDYVEKTDGSRRLMMAVAEPEELAPDVILASHEHADHLDMDSLPSLMRNGAHLYCCKASERICRDAGFDMTRVTGMQIGDTAQQDGFSVEAVWADHGDSAPDALGFWIETEGVRIYFTGDTSYQSRRMRPVTERETDLLIAPINGEFGNMNERDAAMLAQQASPLLTIPCHFWTFAHHHGDPGHFQDAMRAIAPDVPFFVMCQGERITYPR